MGGETVPKNDENKNKKDRNDDKDIERLLKELEDLGVDFDQDRVKMISVGPKKKDFKQQIMQMLLTVLFNFIIFLSLSGFIVWATFDSIWYLLLFASIFSLIEFTLVLLTFQFVPRKYITLSMGTVLFLPTMLAFILSVFLEIGATPTNANAAIVFFFVFAMIRSFLKNTYTRYVFQKRFQNFKKKKGEK